MGKMNGLSPKMIPAKQSMVMNSECAWKSLVSYARFALINNDYTNSFHSCVGLFGDGIPSIYSESNTSCINFMATKRNCLELSLSLSASTN